MTFSNSAGPDKANNGAWLNLRESGTSGMQESRRRVYGVVVLTRAIGQEALVPLAGDPAEWLVSETQVEARPISGGSLPACTET